MYSCTRYLLASMQRRELMMLACRYYHVHHNNKLHIVRLDYTYMELRSTLRPPRDNDSSVKEHSKYSSRSPQLLRGVNYVGHKTKESGLAQDPRVELLHTVLFSSGVLRGKVEVSCVPSSPSTPLIVITASPSLPRTTPGIKTEGRV